MAGPDDDGGGAEPLFHIATGDDWAAAQADGHYRTSTRGRHLDQVGFIHCALRHQVAGVADAFYRGLPGLVLLVIDPTRVEPDIRYEEVPGGGRFPHLYGPLDVGAVTAVVAFVPDPDGTFRPPEG